MDYGKYDPERIERYVQVKFTDSLFRELIQLFIGSKRTYGGI